MASLRASVSSALGKSLLRAGLEWPCTESGAWEGERTFCAGQPEDPVRVEDLSSLPSCASPYQEAEMSSLEG